MKYIAGYALTAPSPEQAIKDHDSEFYRIPCNIVNGKSLGEFVKTEQDIKEYDFVNNSTYKIKGKWTYRVVQDLFTQLEENGINPPSIRIKAGYSAYLNPKKDKVLAETYVARSGNAVCIIHKNDESILYVNSRRHGIPYLARKFSEIHPHKILMYQSQRPDQEWYKSGLENPNKLESFNELTEKIYKR